MGNKDLTEKLLEDYNDVFADIVNVLVFNGERRIDPADLKTMSVHSQYKADNNVVHEQERDVYKEWVKGNVEIAICGLENQTRAEKIMPLRVIGYDGASYRSQILDKDRTSYMPVITLVLYFGKSRWNQPKTLKNVIRVPNELDGYVNDYKINVFEISWLSDEQIAMFESDFKVVANFFSKKRKNPNYIPDDPTEIKHVDEVLKLLSVMTGDNRYEGILQDSSAERMASMCDVATRLENRGIQKGREEGLIEGRAEGENDALNRLAKNIMKDQKLSYEEALEKAKIWLR